MWFQKWHEELGELSLEHPKIWKLYTDGFFLSKSYNVSGRQFQRNSVSWHWRVLQNLKENWLETWKMTFEIWLIFMWAVKSLKICTLMCYYLSITYKVSAKKVQKNNFSWHWKKIHTLKKKCLFIWKMTRVISWNLIWALESLKVCTFMGNFWKKYVMFELQRYKAVVLWKMTYRSKNDISNLVNFYTISWK